MGELRLCPGLLLGLRGRRLLGGLCPGLLLGLRGRRLLRGASCSCGDPGCDGAIERGDSGGLCHLRLLRVLLVHSVSLGLFL